MAALVILAALPLRGAPGGKLGIDPQAASRYFDEALDICTHDAGKLWGVSLCGPMLFVDPASREIVANQPDAQAGLTRHGKVFVGHLPKMMNIANTALTWAGIPWTMIMWPLPSDAALRDQLMMHELFHRIQAQIGLPASNPSNAHLDTLEGRIWLELEWRALARALATSGAGRRAAVEDALVFSAYRRSLFPGAASQERALEMNEGLAEYTGVKLRGTSQAETIEYLIHRLNSAENAPSFMRSFAYVSGPPEGLLLDFSGVQWRKGLTPQKDLETLLAKTYHITLPDNLKEQAEARSKAYGSDMLRAIETAKQKARDRIFARYRVQLVGGHVLVIPLHKMSMQFDPRNLLALGKLGTVYPTMRVTDDWGILEVTGGALMAPHWNQVTVAAPPAPLSRPLRGPGWTLKLKPGWRLIPGSRRGDFVLAKKHQ